MYIGLWKPCVILFNLTHRLKNNLNCVNCKSLVHTITISIEHTVNVGQTYLMRKPTAPGASKSAINKISIKYDYEKNHHKDKRIDSLTIHQNQIKNSYNPILKSKIKQTDTLKWKAKKKNGKRRNWILKYTVDFRENEKRFPFHFDLQAC